MRVRANACRGRVNENRSESMSKSVRCESENDREE